MTTITVFAAIYGLVGVCALAYITYNLTESKSWVYRFFATVSVLLFGAIPFAVFYYLTLIQYAREMKD